MEFIRTRKVKRLTGLAHNLVSGASVILLMALLFFTFAGFQSGLAKNKRGTPSGVQTSDLKKGAAQQKNLLADSMLANYVSRFEVLTKELSNIKHDSTHLVDKRSFPKLIDKLSIDTDYRTVFIFVVLLLLGLIGAIFYLNRKSGIADIEMLRRIKKNSQEQEIEEPMMNLLNKLETISSQQFEKLIDDKSEKMLKSLENFIPQLESAGGTFNNSLLPEFRNIIQNFNALQDSFRTELKNITNQDRKPSQNAGELSRPEIERYESYEKTLSALNALLLDTTNRAIELSRKNPLLTPIIMEIIGKFTSSCNLVELGRNLSVLTYTVQNRKVIDSRIQSAQASMNSREKATFIDREYFSEIGEKVVCDFVLFLEELRNLKSFTNFAGDVADQYEKYIRDNMYKLIRMAAEELHMEIYYIPLFEDGNLHSNRFVSKTREPSFLYKDLNLRAGKILEIIQYGYKHGEADERTEVILASNKLD